MALVSDISGVCKRGDTRLISSKPEKRRQHEHYRFELKSVGILPLRSHYLPLTLPLPRMSRRQQFRNLGCTTLPSCVTRASRMISSSRSSPTWPSRTSSLRHAAMLRAKHLAGVVGNQRRKIQRPRIVTPLWTTVSPGRVSSQLPPAPRRYRQSPIPAASPLPSRL